MLSRKWSSRSLYHEVTRGWYSQFQWVCILFMVKWKISKMIFEIWEIDTTIVMHACGVSCRRIWYERMFWDEWRSLSCKESGLKIDVISYRGEFLKQVSRHVRNWYHWWSLRLDRISRFVIVRYFYEYSKNDFWMDKFIVLESVWRVWKWIYDPVEL